MVALARALEARGDRVSFATAAPLAATIRADGFEVDEVGLSFAEIGSRRAANPAFAGVAAAPDTMRMVNFTHSFAGYEVPPRLEGLRRVIRGRRPGLLVYEMAEFAGPLAAALERVPAANHAWGPMVEADVMEAAGAAAGAHWAAHGLEPPDRGGMYDHLYLDVAPASLQFPHVASVRRRQPLRPRPLEPASPEPAPWLEALGDRPVVAVTLGTVFNERPDILRSAVLGLGGTRFDVVIASGRSEAGRRLGPLPSNVQVHDWVPWAELVARSAVVVTHGGAGSTLGPLASGVPLVIIPLAADHFTNAGLAAAAGAAVVLDSRALDPEGLRAAVETALGEPVRAAAARVAAEIAAMPAPEVVAARLGAVGAG